MPSPATPTLTPKEREADWLELAELRATEEDQEEAMELLDREREMEAKCWQ